MAKIETIFNTNKPDTYFTTNPVETNPILNGGAVSKATNSGGLKSGSTKDFNKSTGKIAHGNINTAEEAKWASGADLLAIQRNLQDLIQEVYSGNFSAHQDFNKVSYFNSRLKIPVNTTLPATCDVGEIICSGGKFYVCLVKNVWTEK